MIKLKMNNNNWDPNLTPEQNYILKQEGTESRVKSLNNEKEKERITALGVEQNYLIPRQNMKVVRAGLLFSNLYLMYLKKKLICT